MDTSKGLECLLLGAGLPTRRFYDGLGAGLPSRRFWGRLSRVDPLRSAAAVTVPAQVAGLAAAEAGFLGHELRTFRVGEGAGPLVRVLAHGASVHIHGDDLVSPVAVLASGGVLGAECGDRGSLGRRAVVSKPEFLGQLLLRGVWSSSVGPLVEPSVLELLVDCLPFSGFLLPGG